MRIGFSLFFCAAIIAGQSLVGERLPREEKARASAKGKPDSGPKRDAGSLDGVLASLKDQHDKKYISAPGKIRVIVLGDRWISTDTQAWADELEGRRLAGVEVIRVLSLADVPRIASPIVKRRIRNQIKKKPIRVFIDWDGALGKLFAVSPSKPSVICVGPAGALAGIISGPMTDENKRALELLLRAASSNSKEGAPAKP